MRVLIQRVLSCSVIIDNNVHGKIDKGLLILLGIENSDEKTDIEWLCRKIVNMRIFNDEQGIMNLSALDTKADILIVSQFTLHASTKKGNRPSYIHAAKPEVAVPLYESFIQELGNSGLNISTGKFGADMKVELINDGPVTIWLDSKKKE